MAKGQSAEKAIKHIRRRTRRRFSAEEKLRIAIQGMRGEYSIVIVTHSMEQAARVSDWTGFFWLGEMVEYAPAEVLFTNPEHKLTYDYITGRAG